MRIIVLGAPGAGKGTQARNLAKHYHMDHISTGDILREEMKNKTAIGLSITALMNAGQLVSDEIAIQLVNDRISRYTAMEGFILDGFPRNLPQAQVFDPEANNIHRVVEVKVSDDVIVLRMSGRVICSHCAAMYHTFYFPPKIQGICDHCGSPLVQREDDKAKTVIDRLALYHKLTEPIVQYYKAKSLHVEVSGIGEASDITREIIARLES